MATVLVVDDSPTIRGVVGTVLERRGYDTVAAGNGEEALLVLGDQEVDLVLLDFVMPVMNGYQFCRHLRAEDRFEKLPVVLMSAKGDKIRGQFVQQTGAVDAITKPFDPKALVAVVESALRKSARAELPPDEDDGTLNISALERIADPEERAQEVQRVFAKAVTRFVSPQWQRFRTLQDLVEVESALQETLTKDALEDLEGILRLLNVGEEDHSAVLAGDLGFISIAEVLQMLELQRQTGALRILAGDQEIALFLSNGQIDLAQCRNLPSSFRLGRFLVEDGVLSRDALGPILTSSDAKGLLGEELVARNAATEEQITLALKRQTSELVYEVVRWKTGRFTFANNDGCPEAALAQLKLAPGGLMMEGFRRVDEWQLIEGLFKFDDVLVVDAVRIERLGETEKLTAQEELVLSTIDGRRTVRQVVDDLDASTFDVCKTLGHFLKAKLLRPKSVGT